MYKYFVSCAIMQRNAAVLTVVCILLCLTFNYTFPLHRVSTKWSPISYHNHTKICDAPHSQANIERAKKMAVNLEDSRRKLKDSSKDKNIDGHDKITMKHSVEKNSLSEDDFRQYEQLVIMKKYPYLDLKELEIRFSPTYGKNARQSVEFDGGSNFAGDSGICEPVDDGPNVEIVNRGLTGFAIPAKISKAVNMLETKLKVNNMKGGEDAGLKTVKLTKPEVLGSLKYDIKEYKGRKQDRNKLNFI